ncbi:two-component system response regulator [Pleurocapsa sp. CCALA 161]|uniref:response regulator n=1 Tax=Pleurocapsa sp. CCALA 161 TaxID=2107688 RepID=UPI000D051333|nr:response regulator [Pleurocapsa sp. CCALA 161]PSB12850.1 two-component system response regulator [Pleurocapsa sp. CCALA 161]
MTKKNILLIDDEETIQEVVQVGISIEAGWQVEIASSGLVGIDLAQNHQPDLILLDVMMPGMDGIDTLSHLKNNDKTSTIPVIFLTAKAQAVEKKQFQSLGVVDVITKPFNSMTLASQIAKILRWEI